MPTTGRRPKTKNVYWLIFIWCSASLFIVNATIFVFSLRAISDSQASVGYTLGVIQSLERLEDLAYELQLEQFVLNRDASAQRIERVRFILDELDDKLEESLEIRSEIAGQDERILKLNDKLKAKTTNFRAAINKLSQQGNEQLIFSSVYSTIFIQEVNQLINNIQEEEENYLASQRSVISKRLDTIQLVLFLSNAVGLILVVLLAIWMRRLRYRELAYHRDLEAVNQNLEQKVFERTQALDHYTNELKRSNRELQDFAFVASHDLQEPLRKIRAFVSRINKKYLDALDEQGQDYLKRMDSAAERMSKLIDDLLVFSRVTTKAGQFDRIDLNDVLAAVMEDLSFLIEDAGADVSITELPVLEADATQMRQLFQNLIANAVKFCDADTAPRIKISCGQISGRDDEAPVTEPPLKRYQIVVQDNGIGFDTAYAEKVFMPFQRLVNKKDYKGTGIGLAVCRRIVERHEGTITAESEPGVGTKITIIFPDSQMSERLD